MDLTNLIRKIIKEMINEDNVTSGGEAYMTKFAFGKNTNNRALKMAKKLGFKQLNEVSYRNFNKSVSEVSNGKKLSNAMRNINRRLNEINQMMDYSIRLSEEYGLTNENYSKTSLSELNKIKENISNLYKKYKHINNGH